MNNYCIISHKHQFIYIPIPKIACTSVLNRVAEIIHGRQIKLYKITSHRDVHLNRKNIFNSKYSELHPDTAKAVKKYQDYFKFTFTRNPFDRIHSCYVDKLSTDSYGFDNNLINRYAPMHRGMSFVEFLKTIAGIDVEEMDEHFRPQYTFCPVNYIDFTGKLENITDDWQQIEKILRIDHQPLPVYNKSQEVDYYDDEAEQLVVNIYNKDFKTFGYPKVRPKKQVTEKNLPIIISPASSTKIYPFKDVFLEAGDHTFLVTTTSENPIIIIPYFSIRKGKGILFQIDITSPINTTLTLYYTTWDAVDSPQSRHRKANVRAGENHIVITINEQAIVGRLRFTPASRPASFEINKIEISEHTLPWLEDKDDLTETNKRLFALPPYAQDHKNLFSMANYASLYLPILNVLRPKCICEIGSDAGDNTKLLAEYCAQNGAQLLIVDPVKPVLDFLDSANHVRFSLMKSTDFLRNNHSPANVFFIDGDHNYQTVSQELQLIDNMKQQTDVPFCLFMHDTSWPCAYRDMYYDPDELGVAQSCYCRGKGISPYSECPVDDSQLPASHAFATTEGGPANGVKKAIEDFLAQRDTEWRNIDIASLYGFGVLWTSDRLSPGQYEIFDKLEKHFSYFRNFLAILEWNRMVLYYQISRNSEIWEKQQDHIKKQQDHIKKQQDHIKKLEHWIDRGVKERISDFIKAKTFKNNIDITQRNRQ